MRHIATIITLTLIPLLIAACGGPAEQQTGADPNTIRSENVVEHENHASEENEANNDTATSELAIRTEATIDESRVQFTIWLTNETEESITLPFSSGQQFEIVVRNEHGQEAYRYSEGMMFTQALQYMELEAGATHEWHDEWDRTIEDEKADPGEYEWTAEIIVAEDDEEFTELITEAKTFTLE